MIPMDGILKPKVQINLHLVHKVGYTRFVQGGRRP